MNTFELSQIKTSGVLICFKKVSNTNVLTTVFRHTFDKFCFMEHLRIKASDGLLISAAMFNHQQPKALVQIIHGSVEHKERYFDFARYLNEKGFAVIVADNRGHGESLNNIYTLGYMDSWQQIVDDNYKVSEYICNQHP